MDRSTREVEIKLPFDSAQAARERLERLGATPVRPRCFEDNVVFDRDADPLSLANILLRLRRVDSRAILTLKRPVRGEHRHKVREEHETAVEDADALRSILEGLGFRPAYRYQKYRSVYDLAGLTACLDETPIGCFVELEGDAEAIDREALRLGFGPERYVRETYLELHARVARERGVPRGDMLIESEGRETG